MHRLPDEDLVMCPACLQPALSITEQAMSVGDDLHHLSYQAKCDSCGYHVERTNVAFTPDDAMRQLVYRDLNLVSGSSLCVTPRGPLLSQVS